ncbi:hypothetical protein RugamoR64_08720 [Duganella rhizosphaerae]
MKITEDCSPAPTGQCNRYRETECVWQVRPLTVREYGKRMLKTSCEYLCEEHGCKVVGAIGAVDRKIEKPAVSIPVNSDCQN